MGLVISDSPVHPITDKSLALKVAERDGGVCCLTGKSHSFWDPLQVYPIFPRKDNAINTASTVHLLFSSLEAR